MALNADKSMTYLSPAATNAGTRRRGDDVRRKINYYLSLKLFGAIGRERRPFATFDPTGPENSMVDPRDDRLPNPNVTISMLISESTYKLITAIERLIRWFIVAVVRPCRLHFRWLHW